MADCKNCIHIEVCKSADSCDGRVPGCRHFEPKTKHGRWLPQILLGERVWDCSECKTLGSPQWKVCPVCEAKMDLPRITDQTMKALEDMDRKAHGGAEDAVSEV